MKPKISAYIPCYNNSETISKTIESIQKQAVPVDELFVVDDGSEDDSVELVKSLGIKVIRHKRNLGRGAVRNKAMKEAKNELILCCDATNVLAHDFVEKALVWFKDEKVAAVFGRISQPKASNVVERWRARHLFKLNVPNRVQRTALLITWGTIVRKSAVMEVGNYDAGLLHTEDADLGERLSAKNYQIIYDPKLKVTSLAKDNLWQLLERYWRWYAGKSEEVSLKCYLKQLIYSIKVLVVQDIKSKDFASIPISLILPHYQFWKSWLGRLML